MEASTAAATGSGGGGGGGDSFTPAASPRGRWLEASGPPTNPGGDGEQSADEVLVEDGNAAQNEKWFVIISIVVGCGILTLVLLCVVRKVGWVGENVNESEERGREGIEVAFCGAVWCFAVTMPCVLFRCLRVVVRRSCVSCQGRGRMTNS